LELHNKFEKEIFFTIECFVLYTILCKNFGKICSNITMAEVKYAEILPWQKFKQKRLWKTIQCDNIFDPPVMCFHLSTYILIFL